MYYEFTMPILDVLSTWPVVRTDPAVSSVGCFGPGPSVFTDLITGDYSDFGQGYFIF
ncbi:hypothetical protein DSUL_100021 [Desulfovibrionales bacterium]